MSGLTPTCRIVNVRTAIHVTATNLQASTSTGRMAIGLFILGTVIDFDLVNLGATTNQLSLGTQMGTSCPTPDLRFTEASPAFATATPPYVGLFRPFGALTMPGGTGNFDRFNGLPANNTIWLLPFYQLDAPVTVECWRLELDLTNTVPNTADTIEN